MSTRVHPANRHHCYNLADLRPLLEALGYACGGEVDNDKEARVSSVERSQGAGACFPAAFVSLNKETEELTVTDHNRPDLG